MLGHAGIHSLKSERQFLWLVLYVVSISTIFVINEKIHRKKLAAQKLENLEILLTKYRNKFNDMSIFTHLLWKCKK